MKSILLAINILSLTLLSACGGGGGGSVETVGEITTQSFFIKGDPNELLAGSTLNQESFITTEDTRTYDSFFVASAIDFSQQTNKPNVDSTRVDMEDADNGLERRSRSNFNLAFEYTRGNLDFYEYRDQQQSVILTFVNNPRENKKLELYSVQYEGQAIRMAKPLHYSLKEDKSAFSILYETVLPGNRKAISAIYFSEVPTIQTRIRQELNRAFNYLFGPGVKVFWQNK